MNTNTRNSGMFNSLLPGKNSRNIILNSILPARDTSTSGTYSSYIPEYDMTYVIAGLCIVVVAGLLYYFRSEIESGWASLTESVSSVFNPVPAPAPAPEPQPEPQPSESDHSITSVVEKVLPGSGNQVFNVSSNKYTYYDAEPLCKALGAELATYDQVKEAWSKGADWCNYGWVKGQMAVYPTSEETYAKTQSGPDAGNNVCGQVGVNGGYFDNPELRYGVTCYGKKPNQNLHNSAELERNAPTSPDALAYDKKVAEFKRQAASISILPKNSQSWD